MKAELECALNTILKMGKHTPTEEDDLKIAQDAYAIFRGSKRVEDQNLFPHAWDGLPQHYRDLLAFVVAHARGGL